VWFFFLAPRMQKSRGCLAASTGWFLRILTLGLLLRKVVVTPGQECVVISRRYGWLFGGKRKIPFGRIQAVTYGYSDFWDQSKWSLAYDPLDVFRVGLKLRGEEEVHLFYFMGDGSFTNDGPLPDWLYWENYLLDWTGPQERGSKLYVELLSKMIGVTVAPPSN
jgi:hypothetical protein